MAEASVLSRRRVLIGAAWATPVVLVATAVAAAAASGLPGTLALYQPSTVLSATTMYARMSIAFAGDGGPSPDLPVTTVKARISVPTNRVTANVAPAVTGAGWSYFGRTSASGTTVFTFNWVGSDLSHVNTSTTELVAAIPKPTSMNTLNVTYTAHGFSNAVAVPTMTQTAAAVNSAVIAFAAGVANRVVYQTSFTPVGGGASFPAYRMRAHIRWGNYTANVNRPASEPITNGLVEVAIPAAYTTGARYDRTATSVGAGWTLLSGPTLSGGVWRLTYAYSGSLTAASRNATSLDFMMRAVAPKALNVVTLTATGLSAGVATTSTHVGPSA